MMMLRFIFVFNLFATLSLASDITVLMTEVFEIVINPSMFNWTFEDKPNQFRYQASLLNYPDLPSWISYVYSNRHHCGYLYGVPPNENNAKFQLQIVALNRKNYETEIKVINIFVAEKLNPAKYEVHMKIDNLNVEDMFDVERMDRLKNIYQKHLWGNSENDLYVTFLASAIQLGARKPLNPKEGEGVVLRLGSQAPFSDDLIELQEEVKPLWKVPSCPRDFKRTSVERFFRNAGFLLDWCSFKLIDNNNSTIDDNLNSGEFFDLDGNLMENSVWDSVRKDEVPQRNYLNEFLLTLVVPILVMLLLVLVLSIILCFHREGITEDESEEFFDNLFHICTDYVSSKRMENAPQSELERHASIERATQSLRSLSMNRDLTLSLDPLPSSRSHPCSPTSTLNRGVHCRPSPPPYVRPKYKISDL